MIELSILIPTYERASYLDRCLELLSETEISMTQFEILVLDDSNSVNVAAICAKWQKIGLPLKVFCCPFKHPPRNAAKARNIGIKQAQGRIIAQTEPELLFNIDYPKVMLETFESNRVKLAQYWCKLDYQALVRIKDVWKKVARDYERFRPEFKLPSFKTTYPNMHTGSVLKEHLVKVQGYDERFVVWGGEDDDLKARLEKRGVTLDRIPGYYVVHQWHKSICNINLPQYKIQVNLKDQSARNPDPVRNGPDWGTKW